MANRLSAYASEISASANFSLLGSTIRRASKVSTHARIHSDRFPAGSLTLNTFSTKKSGFCLNL